MKYHKYNESVFMIFTNYRSLEHHLLIISHVQVIYLTHINCILLKVITEIKLKLSSKINQMLLYFARLYINCHSSGMISIVRMILIWPLDLASTNPLRILSGIDPLVISKFRGSKLSFSYYRHGIVSVLLYYMLVLDWSNVCFITHCR